MVHYTPKCIVSIYALPDPNIKDSATPLPIYHAVHASQERGKLSLLEATTLYVHGDLEKWIDRCGADRVVIVLPSATCWHRSYSLPSEFKSDRPSKILTQKIEKILKFEARQQIPFPPHAMHVAYKGTDYVHQDQWEISLRGVKKVIVDRFEPLESDIIVSAADAWEAMFGKELAVEPCQITGLLYSDGQHLDLSIHHGRSQLFARSVPINKEKIASAPEFASAEVRRSLDFFVSQPYGAPVDLLLVADTGVDLTPVVDKLTVPYKIVNPLEAKFDNLQGLQVKPANPGMLYAAAGLFTTPKTINLLENLYQKAA